MKTPFFIIFLSLIVSSAIAQDCFSRLQKAFETRGAYPVSDTIHTNVILSFFEDFGSICISGKVRVENGMIESIFRQFEDDTYEIMDKKFYNSVKQQPTIINGISEMIYNTDGEKFKVVFISVLKPKIE